MGSPFCTVTFHNFQKISSQKEHCETKATVKETKVYPANWVHSHSGEPGGLCI
jgi:hypothetical protein